MMMKRFRQEDGSRRLAPGDVGGSLGCDGGGKLRCRRFVFRDWSSIFYLLK